MYVCMMGNKKKEIFEEEVEELYCPKCKSSEVYTRLKTWERVCRKCGNVWRIRE